LKPWASNRNSAAPTKTPRLVTETYTFGGPNFVGLKIHPLCIARSRVMARRDHGEIRANVARCHWMSTALAISMNGTRYVGITRRHMVPADRVPHRTIGIALEALTFVGNAHTASPEAVGIKRSKITNELPTVTDNTLKKIIVTVAAVTSLLLWSLRERNESSAGCTYNCNTDISAQRR
jgi:hypothetical protein